MKTKGLVLLLLIFCCISCDPYIFRVAIDGNGFEKKINFEYGEVEILSSVLADRQIHIFLKFKSDSLISINTEGLIITHKGELLKTRIALNDDGLLNSDNNEIRIIIDRVVQAGDTIKINIDNFILCKENPLEFGNINLVIVQR